MPRKATITKTEIISAAFEITRKEGFDRITSRGLAAAAGCSTQPIFRLYSGMDQLKKDVYETAVNFYEEYYRNFDKPHDTPFVDLGAAYIGFAKRQPHLFRLLFLSDHEDYMKSTYDLVNGGGEVIGAEVQKAAERGVQNAQHLFMKMWIFIHGAACMAVTGDYDLSEEDTIDMLTSSYEAFGK